MFTRISLKRAITILPLIVAALAASSAMSVGTAMANGIQVLTAVTPGQYVNVWTNLGTQPVLQIFVNPPIHDAAANTYNKSSVPYSYRVEYAVCSNTPTRLRVIGRYDRNGGKHSNLTGNAQSNWVVFENKTYSSLQCSTTAQPIPGWPGYTMCLGQPIQSSGTVDMSSVTANNTTMQFVAKMHGGSFYQGFFPDEQIITGQAAVAITAVNIWLNWGSSSSSSSSMSSSSSSSSSVSSIPGTGCIDVLKEAFDRNGNEINPTPTFGFRLDNGVQVGSTNGNGNLRFHNVQLGMHTVTELQIPGWEQVLVTPANGMVNVTSTNSCAAVVFKNRQNTPPECSDGVDNADPEDNLADALDPGCHTDGNPNNPGTYDPNDPSENNNNSSSSASSIRFDISVDDDEDEVEPEDDITYVVEVTNRTNQTVNNVTVTTELDNDVNFDDCSDDCDDDDERITWTGLNFGPNETKYLTIDAEVDEDAEDGDELETEARVFNERDTDDTDVVEDDVDHDEDDDDADIELHKDASTSEVFPGGMVQYTIRIRNTGDMDLEDFTVTDTLPMGVQVIDDGNADRNSGGRLVWEIDQLDVGDTWSVSYRVSVPQWTAPGTILRNDVRVLDQETGVNVGTMAIVSVIGALPQTGGDVGGLFTMVISMIGVGAGVGMKYGKRFI